MKSDQGSRERIDENWSASCPACIKYAKPVHGRKLLLYIYRLTILKK